MGEQVCGVFEITYICGHCNVADVVVVVVAVVAVVVWYLRAAYAPESAHCLE